MRVLGVHPHPLMYFKAFVRLEPLGLELVAAAARRAGHEVRLLDFQVQTPKDYFNLIDGWKPDVVAFSCNYLANLPEIVDLSKLTKERLPNGFILVGGHSASFVATEFLKHGAGAIDCVLKGEGEAAIQLVLEAVEHDPHAMTNVPGVVTLDGEGPASRLVESLDDLRPARDLLCRRHKYFMGLLDPCASIEFTRGCPWDCSFCSAWTFYGRSYRAVSPERVVEDLEAIDAPGVFIVDDVAFVQPKHALEIGEAIARRGVKKEYYLETRGDVLLRNKEVFRFWSRLGLRYVFLGVEAIDEEGLRMYRKRISLGKNFEALECARSLDIRVAINLIVDPSWDEARFEAVRQWCLEIPEIVTLSVNTPYPGTESWHTEARKVRTRDYRLFDVKHAVLPTKLPLAQFYAEFAKTQQVLNTKYLAWEGLGSTIRSAAGHMLRGRTNLISMLWQYHKMNNPLAQLADHELPVKYEMDPPPMPSEKLNPKLLFIHGVDQRHGRAIDDNTARFVEATRMASTPKTSLEDSRS